MPRERIGDGQRNLHSPKDCMEEEEKKKERKMEGRKEIAEENGKKNKRLRIKKLS
jgi:hypothetical protein